ncbi:isochorismatase family protein [Nocardiopsis halotolerans]|uniref:isochorismatase family protein n=1 Tax=Nocardiopsis halotolerans TaxID=124252 RepID=UPI00034B3392|nr:isochorismatase family protein [Nocardiopsis halotolerans]
MPLPRIESYPMPGEGALPDDRMSWSVDPDRCVLLIHDMQRYFLDAFPADEEPVPSLLANIGALRRACAALDVPRVYTAQPGSQDPRDRGLLRDLWGEGLRDDPAHTAIVDGLEPADDEVVMTKWRYSAFARTGLEEYLRDTGRDQLVVCGVYAHIGVLVTACDAFMRDVQAFVVADAVADFSPADHAMALSYAARRCAGTSSTKEVLAALHR